MRWSSAAAGAMAKRDEEISRLKAELGKTEADLKKECKKTEKMAEQARKKDAQIRQERSNRRAIEADLRAEKSEGGRAARREARLKSAVKRQKEEIAELKKEIAELKRTLRAFDNPSTPPSKTRQRRAAGKKEEREGQAEEGQEGGPAARRPGGQPGRKATRREFPPDRRVVIKKPDGCGTPRCKGHVRVRDYRKRTMYEQPPPRRAVTIEAQSPLWECNGCGASGTETAGTAVPLHVFKPEEGDAEPDRPAAEAAAAGERGEGEEEKEAERREAKEEAAGEASAPAPIASGAPIQASIGPVEAIRAALGVGDAGAATPAPVNDIPEDRDEPFSIRLPKRGVFGQNAKIRAIKNALYRVPLRKNREALKDDGIEVSEGQTSNIVTGAGLALGAGLEALIVLLAASLVIHADKTMYRVNDELWGLWVFFDPLRKIAVYWLSPDGDNAVLERILGAWSGIIVCDGAPVFQKYTIQRCWAHILNEAKFLARNHPGNEDVLYVLARLQKIFHDAKAYTGTHKERMKKRYEFTRRVRDLVDYRMGDPALAEFKTRLDNAAYDLFLFVVKPWVPPTNNPAENLLREPVVLRKIRGALRSLAGVKSFCALMSCKATWELHGLRPLAEIRRIL